MTQLPKTVRLQVQRYDRETGTKAHYDTFEVPAKPSMTVLDALFYVLEEQDRSLAFRYSCRSAVCGSCATFINGRQRLACNTQISELGRDITVGPLQHIPVIRDLMVDLRPFFDRLEMVKPYFEASEPHPAREFIQSPKDREALGVSIDCIDCMACFSACPMTWTDHNHPGPAAFVKAARFIADTRASDRTERLNLIGCEDGVWRCHTVFNCADACPKAINPPHFIQYLKRKSALASLPL